MLSLSVAQVVSRASQINQINKLDTEVEYILDTCRLWFYLIIHNVVTAELFFLSFLHCSELSFLVINSLKLRNYAEQRLEGRRNTNREGARRTNYNFVLMAYRHQLG